MNCHISDLLDGLENAGQSIAPHGGDAERVKALTLSRIKAQPKRRRFRPLTAAAAVLAAVLLLGGTVFAAWKLGAFRFTDEFGPAGEILDSHAQTYASDAIEVIPADFGYASWVKAEAGGYNLVLLELSASGGQLCATVDVSPKDESLPPLRDSELTLAFADYETTVASSREIGAWKDRVELCAALDTPLADDAEIVFSLSRSGETPALAAFPLNALDTAREEMLAADRHHYAVAAETQDYRFSLRSLSVSPSVIYAVLDVEALTDYGRTHLDAAPEFAVYNFTHQSSGTLLDARLVGSEENLRRYLIGHVGSLPLNEVGDTISFEILELFEEGDAAGHPYYLFDVKLEALMPDAVTLSAPEGSPAGSITWQSVSADAVGLNIVGAQGEERCEPYLPTVTLVFSDGTRETVLDDSGWHAYTPRSAHDAVTMDFTGWHDGTAHLCLIFDQSIDIGDLEAVVVDGQTFHTVS